MRKLTTERLILASWQTGDAEALAMMNADPEVMRHIGSGVRTYAGALAEAREFLAKLQVGPLGLWPIREKSTTGFCGWVGLMRLDGGEEIEIGYRLARAAWGRGIATEAAGRLLRHAFDDLNFDTIVAVTSAENVASQRVLTKLGMQYRGLREVYGVAGCWYYVLSQRGWRRLRNESDI